jgi:nitrogen fixation NifU-like protein
MVTEMAKGKTVEEASRINPEIILKTLGGLPEDHVHCAALAANTLKKALENYLETYKFPWKRAYL